MIYKSLLDVTLSQYYYKINHHCSIEVKTRIPVKAMLNTKGVCHRFGNDCLWTLTYILAYLLFNNMNSRGKSANFRKKPEILFPFPFILQ